MWPKLAILALYSATFLQSNVGPVFTVTIQNIARITSGYVCLDEMKKKPVARFTFLILA